MQEQLKCILLVYIILQYKCVAKIYVYYAQFKHNYPDHGQAAAAAATNKNGIKCERKQKRWH